MSSDRVTRGAPCAAVLWDMDGTLSDSEPLHRRTLEAVLACVGARADTRLLATLVGVAEREVYEACRVRFGFSMGFPHWQAVRNRVFACEARHLAPRAGALALLRALHEQDIPQAIVSNSSREVLDLSIGALPLQGMLATTVSRSDVRSGKPDPEPYLLAATRLGIAPCDAFVIEDSPVGATAGLEAGMRVIVWPDAATTAATFPPGCLIADSPRGVAAHLSLDLPRSIADATTSLIGDS